MTDAETLTPFAEDVWLSNEPVRFVGLRLTATMAALRLVDGSVLLYSPVPMTAARRAAVEALGPVAHLYAPNVYHHLWLGEWAQSFPSARVHAPAKLAKKRPDLRIDRMHGSSPDPAFAGIFEEVPLDGFRLEESVLLHRPSGTLVVADLVHNLARPDDRWTKLYASAMGFNNCLAVDRLFRWIGFRDRIAARRCFDQMLALPFDRLVVGHGAPIPTGAKEALTAALSWLPSAG